nr:MAG TPA: hypothetical protein [Bacteriophage sp.]
MRKSANRAPECEKNANGARPPAAWKSRVGRGASR